MNKIGWCDETLNPLGGCSEISPGCDNCYAKKMAWRLVNNPEVAHLYRGTVNKNGWTGKINFNPQQLDKIATWKKPRRIFIGSMSDCFHNHVTLEAFMTIMKAIHDYPQHTFMILTKRPENMKKMMDAFYKVAGSDIEEPLKNLWLGVTVCNQKEADQKIPLLLSTPAAKRFVSIEPMLGEVDISKFIRFRCSCGFQSLSNYKYCPNCRNNIANHLVPLLDWVICGGETGTGHKARPMHPDWVRWLRDQCFAASVPFFFKSWGKYRQCKKGCMLSISEHCDEAGNLIDGVEWKQLPGEVQP